MAYSLAEKYDHKKNMVGFTHAIGEVYDADKNYPDQILYYHKKSYELGEIISKEYQMYAAFDVAYAYGHVSGIELIQQLQKKLHFETILSLPTPQKTSLKKRLSRRPPIISSSLLMTIN